MAQDKEGMEMTFTVQFTRYFEEFGFYDCDTKEFNNLADAWNYFTSIKDTDENAQLWQCTTRLH